MMTSVLEAVAQPELPLTEAPQRRPRREWRAATATPAASTDDALDVERFARALARELPGIEALQVGREVAVAPGLREGDIVLADGLPGRSPGAPGRGVFAILRVRH